MHILPAGKNMVASAFFARHRRPLGGGKSALLALAYRGHFGLDYTHLEISNHQRVPTTQRHPHHPDTASDKHSFTLPKLSFPPHRGLHETKEFTFEIGFFDPTEHSLMRAKSFRLPRTR